MPSRPTAEDRRLDYLRIGADIVAEFDARRYHVPVDALANVKVAAVAERAGVTKGALYHIWPSQEAYRKDLLVYLLEGRHQVGADQARELLADLRRQDLPPEAVLHRVADFSFDRLKNDPAFMARFSFYVYADDPDVRELLAQADREVDAGFGSYISAYLDEVGLQIRPPFTIRQLFACITAYVEGLVLRYRTSPELADATVERNGESWSLAALGLAAIIDRFTEPSPTGPAAGRPTEAAGAAAGGATADTAPAWLAGAGQTSS